MGRFSDKIRKYVSCSTLKDKFHFVHGRKFFSKTSIRAPYGKYKGRPCPEIYNEQLNNSKENRLYRTLPKYSTDSGNALKCRKNPSLRALSRSKIAYTNLLKRAYEISGKNFHGINTHEFESAYAKVYRKSLRQDELSELPITKVTAKEFVKDNNLYNLNMMSRLSDIFLSHPGVHIVDDISAQQEREINNFQASPPPSQESTINVERINPKEAHPPKKLPKKVLKKNLTVRPDEDDEDFFY